MGKKRGNNTLRQIKKSKHIYLFILPGLVALIIFRYVPMYFLQIAFKDYRVTRALSNCRFVGLKNFQDVFSSVGFFNALQNTLLLNFLKIVICFPAPIILALLLNEIKRNRYKRLVQTMIYLPHFLSWVVISSILFNFLSVQNGLFNQVRAALGFDRVFYLGSTSGFKFILALSDLWREAGYGTIIYLGALASIDPQLYEAAMIDGANRFQCMWHITLVGIRDTIIVMLILRVSRMLGGNFDQVQTLMNAQVMEVADTLDTYVYRLGVSQSRYSFAAAAGLFNSAVAAILLVTSDFVSKRCGQESIF